MKKHSKQKQEELVHVKIDYNEAVNSRKDVFTTQIKLLELIKVINRYKKLRQEELKSKTKLYSTLSATNKNLTKLKRILPKVKIPDFLEEQQDEIKELKKTVAAKFEVDNEDIESQIQDIRRKLKYLQR